MLNWEENEQTRWLAIRRAIEQGPLSLDQAVVAFQEALDEPLTDLQIQALLSRISDRGAETALALGEGWRHEGLIWTPESHSYDAPLVAAAPRSPVWTADAPREIHPQSGKAEWEWSVVVKTPGVDDVRDEPARQDFFAPLVAHAQYAASLLFGVGDEEFVYGAT